MMSLTKNAESKTAQEDDRGQKMMWFEPRNDKFCNPIEEARQMQVGHDQHHREKQHDRAEVDEAQRIVYTYGAGHEHQDRPDDGCAGTINLHSRKFSQGEYDVACDENRVRA